MADPNSTVQRFLGGGQNSVSEIVGRAYFGKIGGTVGSWLGWGEFGSAGRKFDGAENIGVSWQAPWGPISSHSMWKEDGVWAKVDSFMNSSR